MENQQASAGQAQINPGKGMAIASLVLGIVAVLTGLIYLGAVLGILAIIFGIIALKRKAGKGMAIAGIVTGSIGILGTILAIALVIIAVPALQRNARDTERRTQVMQTVTEIQTYRTNNQGQLPDPKEFSDSFKTRSLDVSASGEPTTDTMVYDTGTSCYDTQRAGAFRVRVLLENGEVYCQGS